MENFTCNFLMPFDNVDETSAPRVAVKSCKRIGNWVGGSVTIDNENVTFRMNKMNAKFQKDASKVIIPRQHIKSIAEGKLLLFFRTVDIRASGRVFRFRLMGKRHERLIDLLRSKQSSLTGK